MRTSAIDLRLATFMLRAHVLHPGHEVEQLCTSVIGLPHYSEVRLEYVMFEAQRILETKRLSNVGARLYRLVINLVGEVETCKCGSTIVATEQFGHGERP